MPDVDKELTDANSDSNLPECPLCQELGDREPNETTLAAAREIQEGRGIVLKGTIAELLAELNEDDPDE